MKYVLKQLKDKKHLKDDWLDTKRLELIEININSHNKVYNQALNEYNQAEQNYNEDKGYYDTYKTKAYNLNNAKFAFLDYCNLTLRQLNENDLIDSKLYDCIGLIRSRVNFLHSFELKELVETVNIYY